MFSLTILEYMSAGLATLVTDVPSVSQAIDHGRTDFAYRDGDVDDSASLLHRLACSPGLRDDIGEAARKVAESYTLDDSAERRRSVVAPMLWLRGAT
jgi:glycosyltransferase involved in cell wall biosynthesis